MGFFDYFRLAKKEGAPLSMVVNSGIYTSILNRNDAVDLYAGWVYACIDRRAKGLAAIDFKLYRTKRDGEVEEIMEHELLDLLYKVNPQMTKYDLISYSVVYHDLYGSSPWLLENGKKGQQPTGIYPLRPDCLKYKKDKEGNIIGYTYEIGNFKREYEAEEVIYLKNFNPKQPDMGLGVIEAARQAAEHNDFIKQHNTNLLKNNARHGGTYTIEGKVSEEEVKRMTKTIEDKYQGFANAYKPLILGGGMKFEPDTIPPKDLDFILSTQMNRDEIMAIFGVPKPILGIFDDVNRASAATAEYIFAKWTLEPLAVKYFELLNEYLVPRYGEDLWLWFEPLAMEDDDSVNARRANEWNKWKTTNEIRAEEGLDPLNGGDIIYMPMSNMPYMSPLKTPKEKLRGKSVDYKTQKWVRRRVLNRNYTLKKMVEKAANKISDKLIEQKQVVLRIVPEKKGLSNDQIDLFYKMRMNEEAPLENLWEKQFTAFFEKQKERFIAKLDGTKSATEKYNIDVEQELQATIDIISPLVYQSFVAGVRQASELIGEASIMDMDFVKAWLDKVAKTSGESINSTTIEAFEQTMNEGISAGESLGELKNRVEEVFNFAQGTRATLIARTETARCVTEAHRQMYEYYGFDEVKWLLSSGACEECVVKSSDSWNVKTIEGQIPVHPNCKCDYTPL
jgi:HK97 family phage portal protein